MCRQVFANSFQTKACSSEKSEVPTSATHPLLNNLFFSINYQFLKRAAMQSTLNKQQVIIKADIAEAIRIYK